MESQEKILRGIADINRTLDTRLQSFDERLQAVEGAMTTLQVVGRRERGKIHGLLMANEHAREFPNGVNLPIQSEPQLADLNSILKNKDVRDATVCTYF